ncbi:hypothetical protein B0H67DRAFT_335057 [Lasiosphaeris hirsuta]|uniref:Uncharacterized protein n=1 Tax=Lasiosphaeris hirsuta TaxID=260670 RepID=A0AA40A2W3_9PEZI|nr:hypothetical protein B0H67DRAFT_335057 [Lasiosphaeris hirsuta]
MAHQLLRSFEASVLGASSSQGLICWVLVWSNHMLATKIRCSFEISSTSSDDFISMKNAPGRSEMRWESKVGLDGIRRELESFQCGVYAGPPSHLAHPRRAPTGSHGPVAATLAFRVTIPTARIGQDVDAPNAPESCFRAAGDWIYRVAESVRRGRSFHMRFRGPPRRDKNGTNGYQHEHPNNPNPAVDGSTIGRPDGWATGPNCSPTTRAGDRKQQEKISVRAGPKRPGRRAWKKPRGCCFVFHAWMQAAHRRQRSERCRRTLRRSMPGQAVVTNEAPVLRMAAGR